MTKENFSELINAVKNHSEYIWNLYKDYGIDFVNSPVMEIENEITKYLKAQFDDKCDWINYWMWELNFGENWKPGTVTENGNDIPLKTIDDLWNLLTK